MATPISLLAREQGSRHPERVCKRVTYRESCTVRSRVQRCRPTCVCHAGPQLRSDSLDDRRSVDTLGSTPLIDAPYSADEAQDCAVAVLCRRERLVRRRARRTPVVSGPTCYYLRSPCCQVLPVLGGRCWEGVGAPAELRAHALLTTRPGGLPQVALTQYETYQLLMRQVKVCRSVHRPHRRARLPRVVCAHCVAVWPCRAELWVRAVLGEAS